MSRWALLLVVCAVAGCKKPIEQDQDELAIAKMVEFADQMCACAERRCAELVQETMTKWSADMAARMNESNRPTPDEAKMKRMTEISTRYGECMTKAMTASTKPDVPARDVVKTDDAPPDPSSRDADTLVRQVREWGAQKAPGQRLVRVRYSFVDASGGLDPTFGSVDVELGHVEASKTPRRLGTPVVASPPPREDCVSLTTRGRRWLVGRKTCAATVDYVPHCTPAAIWKRAIAKQAPVEAVATIEYDGMTKTWKFAIDDEPTQLHFTETFDDGCELNVER